MSARWAPDPTGRHDYRYWNGRWTDDVADGQVVGRDPLRKARRQIVGLALVGQLALLLAYPFVAFWFVGGDPYPVSRAGLTRNAGGDVEVLNAGCPGERLRAVELRRYDGDRYGTLWSVSGDIPLPQRFVMGQRVRGMSEETKLSGTPSAGELDIRVETNQLDHPSWMEFRPGQVRRGSVLSFGERYPDVASFREAAVDATPCPDDRWDPTPYLWLMLALAITQIVVAAGGVLLLVLPRYRSPP